MKCYCGRPHNLNAQDSSIYLLHIEWLMSMTDLNTTCYCCEGWGPLITDKNTTMIQDKGKVSEQCPACNGSYLELIPFTEV